MNDYVEISTSNSGFSTQVRSIKVSESDCDNDEQSEMASLTPELYFHFRLSMTSVMSGNTFSKLAV